MTLRGEARLERIYLGESDVYHGRPLYQAIVQRLRQEGIAGATVLRAIEGFGATSHLHTARILRLSEDLPLVIEVVDSEEAVARVLPELDDMLQGGLVTVERVEVVSYRGRPPDEDRPS